AAWRPRSSSRRRSKRGRDRWATTNRVDRRSGQPRRLLRLAEHDLVARGERFEIEGAGGGLADIELTLGEERLGPVLLVAGSSLAPRRLQLRGEQGRRVRRASDDLQLHQARRVDAARLAVAPLRFEDAARRWGRPRERDAGHGVWLAAVVRGQHPQRRVVL